MSTLELLQEFNQLGCKDQIKVALAFRVYQNLQLAKKYSDIEKVYDKDLNLIYILGRAESTRHVFLPSLSTQNLEMFELELIQTKMKELYGDCIIHLAICDTASNILFYTITNGFLDNKENVSRKR